MVKNRRATSILLAICLFLALMPVLSTAADAASNPYPKWQDVTVQLHAAETVGAAWQSLTINTYCIMILLYAFGGNAT